ncbi:hypothetical protein N7527_006582 [Penicillium freii]|nr:hypothetical protein N7527_006582 [Penicillium freii]
MTFLTCGNRSSEFSVRRGSLQLRTDSEKATGLMIITLHLKIVYGGESKTQFVSNVFDVVVRWYSRFRDTFAIRRAGSSQHNEGAFDLREVRSKTDRGRITVPDDICPRISICPTTQ